MIRILTAEDTKEEARRLRDYLDRYARERGIELQVRSFSDGAELVEAYPTGGADLVLLDIEMERMGGVEAARRIRELDQEVTLLFITRMVQYALEGFEVGAADYIVKPVAYPLFAGKLDRAMRRVLQRRPRFVRVTAGRETHTLQIQRIICVEALNKKTIVHLPRERTLEISQSLRQVEKLLEGEPFFRCHNAFLINLGYVEQVAACETVVGGITVPVSKYRKKEFLEALTSYRGSVF